MDDDAISDQTKTDLEQADGGTVIGDKLILSRAQVAAIVTGSATLAGVLGLAGGVSAQEAGTLGLDGEEIDATLGNFGSTSTASGYEVTIDGDTFQINE